jgi:hypothetical protein
MSVVCPFITSKGYFLCIFVWFTGVGDAGTDPVRRCLQPANGPGAKTVEPPVLATRPRRLRRLPWRVVVEAGEKRRQL